MKPMPRLHRRRSSNHHPDFAYLRHLYPGRQIEQREDLRALSQGAESKLRDDKRMDNCLAPIQLLTRFFVSGAEMLDPDRSIGEDQFRPARRHGMHFNAASCLPGTSIFERFPARSAPSALPEATAFSPPPGKLLGDADQVVIQRNRGSYRR
jgi:hypothetical protein